MTKLAIPIRRKVEYDGDSSSVQYVGEANFGTAGSEAAWRIQRLTYTGGSITVEWADGNDNFDNVWADRASLTYS